MRIESITAAAPVQATGRSLPKVEGGISPAAPPAPTPAAASGAAADDFARVTRAFEEALEPYGLSLRFSRDEETGATVIRLVEQETGEVVRQIPQEALLRLSAALGKLQGSLFERRA